MDKPELKSRLQDLIEDCQAETLKWQPNSLKWAEARDQATEALYSLVVEAVKGELTPALLAMDFQAVCPDCGSVGEDSNANLWCSRCKAQGWVKLEAELALSQTGGGAE